jgi:hypothetical protein
MKDVSQKLTLGQMSKDMHTMSLRFEEHLKMDAEFHQELKESLTRIEAKLDPEHEDFILLETNKKVDQLWALFQGLSFAGNAIKYTAGVVAGISVIIVSLFALIRYVK